MMKRGWKANQVTSLSLYNCAVLTIEVIPLDAAEASLNELRVPRES